MLILVEHGKSVNNLILLDELLLDVVLAPLLSRRCNDLLQLLVVVDRHARHFLAVESQVNRANTLQKFFSHVHV